MSPDVLSHCEDATNAGHQMYLIIYLPVVEQRQWGLAGNHGHDFYQSSGINPPPPCLL